MSIVHTLKKIVDPMQARLEEAQRKKTRERKEQEVPGEPPVYVCRVCGARSNEGAYCPRCLADTMSPRENGGS
jgi:rubrerythrin